MGGPIIWLTPSPTPGRDYEDAHKNTVTGGLVNLSKVLIGAVLGYLRFFINAQYHAPNFFPIFFLSVVCAAGSG